MSSITNIRITHIPTVPSSYVMSPMFDEPIQGFSFVGTHLPWIWLVWWLWKNRSGRRFSSKVTIKGPLEMGWSPESTKRN